MYLLIIKSAEIGLKNRNKRIENKTNKQISSAFSLKLYTIFLFLMKFTTPPIKIIKRYIESIIKEG